MRVMEIYNKTIIQKNNFDLFSNHLEGSIKAV